MLQPNAVQTTGYKQNHKTKKRKRKTGVLIFHQACADAANQFLEPAVV
jgi:hypothetical protein